MAHAQDVQHPSFPVHVHDHSVVSDPELVGFDRAEARQVAGGAHGHRLELAGNPFPDGLVQLSEFLRGKLGELNSERQTLIPLSRGVREGPSSRPGSGGAIRRRPRSF